MSKKKFLAGCSFCIIIFVFGHHLDANNTKRTFEIDPVASSIYWVGKKKIGTKHSGNIQIKVGKIKKRYNFFSGKIVMNMRTISATSVTGKDKKKLEKHLKGKDFFSVRKYPQATLEIKKVVKGKMNNYKVYADLTIKGITEPVRFSARVEFFKDKMRAKGKLIFDRTDYDIKYNSGSFFPSLIKDRIIKDQIKIIFEIRGKPE